MPNKRILIIAGPNGAGKTVFATDFLPNEANCPTFINADLIAAGLSPFRPDLAGIRAARLMLSMIHEYVEKEESFAFETTLSGRDMPGGSPAGSNRVTGSSSSFYDCQRLRWPPPVSGSALLRVATMCPNRSFAAGFMPDGATLNLSTGTW